MSVVDAWTSTEITECQSSMRFFFFFVLFFFVVVFFSSLKGEKKLLPTLKLHLISSD